MLALILILPLAAQIDNGNITGRVTDPTGAVIAGAQVTVIQTAMNFETVTQTNEEGLYRAQSLRPGPYRITIAAAGFKKLVRDGVDLRMGDTLAVNAQLEVGAIAESVEVTASVPLLQTETSATSTTVAGDYFYSLPNYQRNTKGILYFTPGLTYGGLNWTGSLSGMHINGMRSNYIGVFEDGAIGTIGDGMTTDSILNTIEDVKVLTTTLPAEYGHSAGGAISVVKKTGTNQFHGILSEFGRTRRMQQRKYFDKYRNSQVQPGWDKAPGLTFQNPDANVSGPVYIPKLYDGRNKTFFMFGWQKMIEKQSKQQSSTVPSLDMLNGDFNMGGIGQPIYDPRSTRQDAQGNWLRDIYPGNIIPRSQWSKVAQTVLGMNPYQAPNVAGAMASTGPSGNIMTAPSKSVVWDNYTVRMDQQFNPNLKVYGTWTYNSRWERTPPYTLANSFFDFTKNIAKTTQQTGSTGATQVLSPTLINEVRGSYYRYLQNTPSISYMQDYASQLGISGLAKDAMPQIWPSSTGFTESLNVGNPSMNLQEVLTFKDDMTKVRGVHTFKWGYELMRYRQNQYDLQQPDGTWNYTGTNGIDNKGNSISNTGNNFANFLTGAISSVNFSRRINSNLPRSWEHSFYFQDDWKLTPNLTLNIGVRYQLESPPVQKWGIISIFDPNAVDDSQYLNYTCPTGGCKGAWTHPTGGSAYNWDKNRIDPRVGLAWHPVQRFVIRTGFALTHIDMRNGFLNTDEMITESTSVAQALGNPTPLFFMDQGIPAYSYPTRRADGSVPYRGPAGGTGSGTSATHTASIVQRDMQAAYTMSWNFGVQTQLGKDYMIETQYKGSAQVRNSGSYNINSQPWGMIPNPNGSGMMNLDDPANASLRTAWLPTAQYSRPFTGWGDINMQGNNGHLSHHEGMIKLEKRFSKGFNLMTFYTYSKTLDGNSYGTQYNDWSLNKGRSDYDQTHNFTGTMNYELPVGKGRKFMNRGGWLNTVFGGFNVVWTYTVNTGSPIGMAINGSPATSLQYPIWMPTYGNGTNNRSNDGAVILNARPTLRNNWQDLGGDRFVQNNQNSMIDCGTFVVKQGNDCFTYVPAFSNGTNGRNLWTRQRIIAASMSASKEVPIKERLKLMFRFDFQNPFKWYNWDAPATALDISSPSAAKKFGTTAVGNEASTATFGGVPIMNITLALKW